MFHNKFIFYCEGLLAPRPTPKLEDTPCRLPTATYSMYSQLTSITGSRPSIHDPRTRHAVVTGSHQIWASTPLCELYMDPHMNSIRYLGGAYG
jgi:hypothetical protein